MSKSVAIRSVDEGEPSPPTASGLRRFFRTYWKMLLAILSAVVVAVAIIVIFTGLPPPPPSPGPEVFVRDVYILIDPTTSMSGEDLKRAKDIVKSQVFPYVGPGDRVFCYSIGPGFDVMKNWVFKKGSLPAVPKNFLDPKLAKRLQPGQLASLWGNVNEVTQRDWTEQLDKLSAPVDDKGRYIPGSDYLAAFDFIAAAIESRTTKDNREKRLIVIGDLEQYPLKAISSGQTDKQGFRGAEVHLVQTYRAGKRGPERQIAIEPSELQRFWKDYFIQRGCEKVAITTFDDPTPLLPGSPVPQAASRQ